MSKKIRFKLKEHRLLTNFNLQKNILFVYLNKVVLRGCKK